MTSRGRLLLTGASGFIGRDLALSLAMDGWQVRAAARAPSRGVARDGVEHVMLPDLSGPHDWRPLLDGVSHVVHLAGIAHATASIPEATYHAVNATAVGALAEASRQAGVRRVVMMSSIRALCGPAVAGTLDETRAPAPEDAYGRAKLAGERLLEASLEGAATDWCILRPVVVYGPGVKGNVASLERLARTPWPLPIGGLAARRSILGLPNLHRAVQHALKSPAACRRAFILADPDPLTVPEIVAAMRQGLGRPPGIVNVPLAPARLALQLSGRAAMWQRIAGDLVVSTAALEASGWQPEETAAAGLARWMRDDGAR